MTHIIINASGVKVEVESMQKKKVHWAVVEVFDSKFNVERACFDFSGIVREGSGKFRTQCLSVGLDFSRFALVVDLAREAVGVHARLARAVFLRSPHLKQNIKNMYISTSSSAAWVGCGRPSRSIGWEFLEMSWPKPTYLAKRHTRSISGYEFNTGPCKAKQYRYSTTLSIILNRGSFSSFMFHLAKINLFVSVWIRRKDPV